FRQVRGRARDRPGLDPSHLRGLRSPHLDWPVAAWWRPASPLGSEVRAPRSQRGPRENHGLKARFGSLFRRLHVDGLASERATHGALHDGELAPVHGWAINESLARLHLLDATRLLSSLARQALPGQELPDLQLEECLARLVGAGPANHHKDNQKS